MRVPSASFGAFASAAWTAFRSVVNGRATVGLELKNTTEIGWPGFRAAKARAACIAAWIDPFMLLEASISSTVPMPSAEAEDSTARFFTGWPFSVTVTSSVVSAGLCGLGSVRTYARSGNRGLPASTTWMPLSSAAPAGSAPIAATTAMNATASERVTRLTGGDPQRSSRRGGARTARPGGRSRASRTCRGRSGAGRSAAASR